MGNKYVCSLCDCVTNSSSDSDDDDYDAIRGSLLLGLNRWSNQHKHICKFCIDKLSERLAYNEKPFAQRLVQLEKRVEANQIGLDNVYKEFTKVTKPKVDFWVKFNDKFPPQLKLVMIRNKLGSEVGLGVFHGNMGIDNGWTFHQCERFDVYYWMLIPELK